MDLPDSLRSLIGSSAAGSESDARGSTEPDTDIEEKAARLDGGQIVADGAEDIAIEIPEDSDVDPDRIEAALSGDAAVGDVKGQTGGETTVTPVASGSDIHITDSAFDLSDWEYKAHLDDQIKNLMDNRVDYNTETGKWILANDDLIPGILLRVKSLIMGQDGLEVKPSDPDAEADQRLAEHLERVYDGSDEVETHVDPERVVDRVLEQNVMNAVAVLRSPDLQHLDVDDLSYVKDGQTGEEIYIQHTTSYTTFDLDEDESGGEPEINFEHTDDAKALEIGEEVLDVRLYRTPPLQAVADDVVNKLQLKRLQGRKAEIASIGGIIIKVNPPAWVDEEDYDNHVREEDNEFGDESGRLLDLIMAQQIEAATQTLQEYQTATVMSIPENWETDTIELPEMDESISSMIRDYNQAISRRLILPLDLIELQEGPELSRDSMMKMFLDQISGWQGRITDLFDTYAQIQAEIHGMNGSVDHTLPSISSKDEKQILNLFNFAGLLGMSEAEGRELANTLEGVDLETEPTEGMPPEGGPEDPQEREQQMRDMLQTAPDQPDGMDTEAAKHGEQTDYSNDADTDLDLTIPEAAADRAATAERLIQEEGSDAMNEPGRKRMRMLQDGGKMPVGEIVGATDSVANWFARHKQDAEIRNGQFVPEDPDNPENDDGYVAVLGWGGVPMLNWAMKRAADITGDESWLDHIVDAGMFASESIEAADSFSEGEEVNTPSGMGVIVEVRTENFEGPGGSEVEASDDDPAYVVGVESGVEVYRASDLSDGEIETDVDDPTGSLAGDEDQAMLAAGWVPIEAARGDGFFEYPDSWEESETPARLILMKAWAGMNGQFDCGGDCCKGEMLSSGMSEPAANRFCASMKDRVLGGWEGWRKGGASEAPVRASHAFSRFETMREAAAHVRDLVEKKTPEGHTTEMRKRPDVDDDAFAVFIRDREGSFQGSMLIKESETDPGTWKVIGGDEFLGGF